MRGMRGMVRERDERQLGRKIRNNAGEDNEEQNRRYS